jgi:hypothetical protein
MPKKRQTTDYEESGLDVRGQEDHAAGPTAAAYYPDTNALVPLDSTALSSNQPAFKSVMVRIVPAGTGGADLGGGQDAVGADWAHKSDPDPTHQS